MPERSLILVDALAVLYRAFYAIRDLSTAAGVPTNALFGFVRKLKQLQSAWEPTHLAVVFDGGLPADRLRLLDTYKAQRPPMPAALRTQVALAHDYLACSGIAALRVEGEEADDVMATVAAAARGQAACVRIATGDKDMLQLVDDRVKIIPLAAGEREELGPRDVEAKLGVPPAAVVAWLALTGDNADNIPGVPGVGPKKAAALLNEFRTLDALWEGLARVSSERTRLALAENRAVVERNVAMMRLNTGVAVDWSWDSLEAKQPDLPRLLAFLESVEFRALAAELRQPRLL